MKLDTSDQQYVLASLEGTDLKEMIPLLKEIVECRLFHHLY